MKYLLLVTLVIAGQVKAFEGMKQVNREFNDTVLTVQQLRDRETNRDPDYFNRYDRASAHEKEQYERCSIGELETNNYCEEYL